MAVTDAPPRFDRTPHLVALIAEAERLAAAIASADAQARARAAVGRRTAAALASLRLDGTDLAEPPDDATLEATRAILADIVVADPGPGRPGTWFDAMGVHDELDPAQAAQVQALEYLGVTAALDADDLRGGASDPVAVLPELHRRLTAGLVAPRRVGAHRELDQAVHDASNGRVLFFAAAPARIPGDLALLASWVTSAGAREHGLVTAGVVHHELLRIHPFDAANGRVARASARLVLRDAGLDPDGLAAPEVALAGDPLGYHEEVARTVRRRDLTIWLERWGEAVSDGLRTAARALGQLPTSVPAEATAFLATSDGTFTVADHRAATGLTPAASRTALEVLLDAGHIGRVPGVRGLRFVVRDGAGQDV